MNVNMLIAPLVMVLVEAVKRTELVDKRWLPLVAIVIGLIAGIGWAVYEPTQAIPHLIEGALYGAAAAGLYDAGKSTLDN